MNKILNFIKKYVLAEAVLISAGIGAAAGFALYPSFMNQVSYSSQSMIMSEYAAEYQIDEGFDYAGEKEKAAEYNQEIFKKQQETPFTYQGEFKTDDTYESLLAVGAEKTIGIIRIPKIKVALPIAHGTNSETLLLKAGHLYGTSLPVGGENTHAVLSGHTGLSTAKLFTDLTELEKGDSFYIQVLDETLKYTVDRIIVCLPEEGDKYLQTEAGKDYVSLYTCTPYGINDHRLIVRGIRSEFTSDDKNLLYGKKYISSRDVLQTLSVDGFSVMNAIILGSIPFLILIFGIFINVKKQSKSNRSFAKKKRRKYEKRK